MSDGSTQPYRVRVRPPSFVNLQALDKMVRGALVADVENGQLAFRKAEVTLAA